MPHLSPRVQLIVGLALAALLAMTRGHHFASVESLPSASWAVFFLAGVFVRSRWAFPALFLEAVALDFGAAGMCFVVCGTLAAIVGLVWSLRVIARLANA